MREILTDELLEHIADEFIEAKKNYGDIIPTVTFSDYLETALHLRTIQNTEEVNAIG